MFVLFSLSLFPFAQASPTSAPDYPDLTHPDFLQGLGMGLLQTTLVSLVVLGGLGIIFASLNSSYGPRDRPAWLNDGLARYGASLSSLRHLALIGILVILGFFFCTTLANRYHHWEQARIAKISERVAGDRIEHIAPQLRYELNEPYTEFVVDRGRPVEVVRNRKVTRFLTLDGSQIQAKLQQSQSPASTQLLYQVDLQAEYALKNTLSDISDFTFEAPPPSGYSLLQGYKLERDGQQMLQRNPGDYGFPLKLPPGQSTKIRVTYRAQGGPRWVYNANGQLLANFKLVAEANFASADFASGIAPTQTEAMGAGQRFTWAFQENVSVRNPFGVFTSTAPVSNQGVLPRLLLLAPLILLWWLGLLYLTLPLRLQDLLLAAAVFFAMLLTLTYLSRTFDPRLVWVLLSVLFLTLSWGLGRSQRAALGVMIATLSGAVVPVLALLVPAAGLTLSLAGVMSVGWLAARHWYRPGAA